jgi:prepilin-type N-terminal cleavage/methylation domain-containing protein
MPKVWSTTNQQGFSLVEVLLAATLFGMVSIAVVGALIYGRQSTNESGTRAQATLLAEEGLEAARSIRDSGFANLTNGTFGLAQAGSTWNFSGSADTNDIFTRSVTVANGGTNRKTVTSTVSWPRQGGTSSVTVTTELTNWLASIVKSWLNPGFAGAADAAGTMDGIKVATQGNYAYIVRTDGTPDFIIVNIASLTSPTVVGSLSLSGTPTNVAVSGNYAYVSTTDDAAELRIINVSNPAAPAIAGTYNAAGTADGTGVYLSNNLVYLTRMANGGNDELVVIGGTVAAPTRSAGYSLNVNMYEVYVNGANIYIATGSDTQEILNISYVILGIWTTLAINLPGTTDATTIDGYDNLLVVGQGSTVYTAYNGILNLLNGFNALSSVAVSGTVKDVTLHSNRNLAFIGTTDNSKEFQVINIASITSISLAATADMPGNNILSGVAYNSTLDAVAGASDSDTQEAAVFVPN